MENKAYEWQEDLEQILEEFQAQIQPEPGQILVVGCSTSEILGYRIGTRHSLTIAQRLYQHLFAFAERLGLQLAIQCCEHLNRALVVERETLKAYGLTEVTAIPVPEAGGALASIAYREMEDPVLVETIQGHFGIDIGDTFIGMHLRPVVVPIRVSKRRIGQANVTLAKTRPKLIGGKRAVYPF